MTELLVVVSIRKYVYPSQGKILLSHWSNIAMRKEDEAGFKTLEAENSMVMVWLVNSMDPEIGQTYLFLLTAKEMWDAINKTLSDLGNSTQVYEIKIRICETKKGALGVTKYYGIL